MEIKVLLGILNRPWMIEPTQADYWGAIASELISGKIASVPSNNEGKYYNEDFFRVDDKGNIDHKGPVRVISVKGPITKYDVCYTPGSQTLQQLIRAANTDASIQSIVLWVDSPGGQVDGTDNLAQEIKASAKPIVSFVDGMMCSAAYWLGSSSREIIVDRANNGYNAMIGSIGTMASWKDMTGGFEKIGVRVHTVYATKSTEKNRIMKDANEGNYTAVIEELDNLNETFLSAVSANRTGKINTERENVLTGKTYNAKDAIKYGLADRMGNFQTAVSRSLQLAKQQSLFNSNNTNMAFQKTLTAAKAQQFAVVDGGFLVEEDHLNNVEAALDAAESTATSLQTQVDTLTAENTQAVADLAAANETITSLTADNARLKKGPAGAITTTVKEGADALLGSKTKVASWQDPNNPFNKAADSIYGARS